MRVIKQSTGTSGEYARVRSVCGVLHPGRARFTASLASQITAMQVPYPLIVPVPRPPPCAATLRFRAASACSYRLCWISFLVCGFSEPPGRRYSHSAHAPAARSTNNPPVAVVVAVIRGHAVPAVPELALVTRFHAKRRGARPATGAAGTAAAVVGLGLGLGLQRESPLEGTGKGGQGLGMCLVMDEGTFFSFFLFQPLLGAVS